MIYKIVLGGLLAGLPMTAIGQEGYFLELTAGYGELSFTPTYHFVNGRPPRSFDDRATGAGGALRLGYRQPLAEQFGIDLGVDLIYQDAEWTMSLPWEAAKFQYQLPYSLGLSVAPGWDFADRWRLFAEFGIQYGHVRERK